MNKFDYCKAVSMYRQTLSESMFIPSVSSLPYTSIIVDFVFNTTMAWWKTINKDRISVKPLSPEEEVWKEYFSQHGFSSMEETRNIADLINLLTGVNTAKFLPTSKSPVTKFPPNICIVPTGNDNGHDYRVGEAIFSFSSGSTFYRKNGSYGNSMSYDVKMFTPASREEVMALMCSLLYRLGSSCETLMQYLPENDDTGTSGDS